MSQQSPLDHSSAADSPAPNSSAGRDQLMEPQGESPFRLSPQPRLAIIHIMLWTLGSAVILAAYRALVDLAGMPEGARAQWYVMQIGYSVVYGAALASVILFIYRRLAKGAPFPVSPGHWLLLAQGIVFIVGFVGQMATWAARNWLDHYPFAMYNVVMWLTNVVGALVILAAILRLNDFAYWRVYFWASLVHQGVRAKSSLVGLVGALPGMWYLRFSFQQWVYALGAIVLVVWLLVAVARDWRRGARRDWLHWTGVIVTLSGPALFAIQIVWSMLLAYD